jgi:hypothetical protein
MPGLFLKDATARVYGFPGADANFRPADKLTRAKFAAVLDRLLKLLGK